MMNHTATVLAQAQADSVLALAVKGGIMMIPIALCSLIVVAVVLERLSVLRKSRVVPAGFERGFEKAMGEGGPDRGAEYCQENASPIARVLGAGIGKMGFGYEIVEKHLAAAGEGEVHLLRKRLRALTVVAAVAPLLGLTGTIFGMIRAFKTVANSGESLGKAELLAGGIYEAMITTAAGLLVAIPAVVLYHYLAARIERLTREMDRIAVAFIERYVLSRRQGHGAASQDNGTGEPETPELASAVEA